MYDFLKKTYLYSLLYLNKFNVCVKDPLLTPTDDKCDFIKFHDNVTDNLSIDDKLIKFESLMQLYI